MSGKEKQTSRKLRFILDALLSLILLLAVFVALSSRMPNREVTRFRRAEKAALVGPSEILDRIDVREEWPSVNYNRLLIGDDGEEILFYLISENGNGFLWRREKTDGILLTPLYNVNWVFGTPRRRDGVLPLFLFSDEPEAVRAEVQIRLSDTFRLELSQVRGKAAAGEETVRERYFLFSVPLPVSRSSAQAQLMQELAATNQITFSSGEFPAVIRLYDGEDQLLETREYTIRSRHAG